MAFLIQDTSTIIAQNLANLEGELNQSSPLNDKAFLRVLSVMEGLNTSNLFRYAAERTIQNLALTATGDDLKKLGDEYGIDFKNSVSTVLSVTLPGTNGTLIPATVSFIGDSNGERYFPFNSALIAGGFASLSLVAENPGVAGNLANGETLSIGSPIAGAEQIATIVSTLTTGAEEETDDEFRSRVLSRIRSPGGGGNAADYKRWAEEVEGVFRAYAFSGRPFADIENSVPLERTINVEATIDIDPDGVPTPGLLTQVRNSIITDPATGRTRQPLGLTNDLLFVEPIRRTSLYVTVVSLNVNPSIQAQVQQDIEDAVEAYFRSLRPFVDGVDPEFEKNNIVTDLTISEVVQNVVGAAGGSAIGVSFSLSMGGPAIPAKTLDFDETAKSGGVTFL